MEKHQKGIYAKRPNPVGDKLSKGYVLFEELELAKQCDVLVQIVKLSSVGAAAYGNVKLIGESPTCGKMTFSKNISDFDELILINQSVTGLFESHIDLLRV